MNIYQKISAIMNDVQYLAKDDHVSFGSTSYKALSEEKVTSIMRQELLKHTTRIAVSNRKSSKAGNFFAFKSAPPRRTAFDICDIPPMSSHVSP